MTQRCRIPKRRRPAVPEAVYIQSHGLAAYAAYYALLVDIQGKEFGEPKGPGFCLGEHQGRKFCQVYQLLSKVLTKEACGLFSEVEPVRRPVVIIDCGGQHSRQLARSIR